MGKRIKLHSQQLEDLTEYEIQRLKRLQFNATRMEAAGFNQGLANKLLQSKCSVNEKHLVDDEMYEIESEPSDNEEEGTNNEVVLIEENPRKNERINTLSQRLPMAEFARLRSQKVQRSSQVQQQQQPQRSSQGLVLQKQQRPSKQQQQQQKSVKGSTSASQKKSRHVQFCSPGSLTMFTKMRQRQKLQRQLEDILDHEPLNNEQEEDVSSMSDSDHILEDDDQLLSIENDASADINDVALQPEIITTESSSLPVLEKVKKHRGPTTMLEVHRRKPDERVTIILNEDGQPIGPTKACVTEFSNFLGTIAKFPHLAPLNNVSWKCVPTKDKIWDYVKARCVIHDKGKKYVMETVNALWRVYKSRVKKKHYKAYATDEDRLRNRPKNIPLQHFEELLEYWNSKLAEEISSKNQKSRGLRVDGHTMGPVSYALVRHELQQKDPNKHPPSQARVYKESRKRVVGRKYKTNNERTLENIEKMDAVESQNDENGEGNFKDPYYEVVAKDERNQHLHLHGRSAMKSKWKDKLLQTLEYSLPFLTFRLLQGKLLVLALVGLLTKLRKHWIGMMKKGNVTNEVHLVIRSQLVVNLYRIRWLFVGFEVSFSFGKTIICYFCKFHLPR